MTKSTAQPTESSERPRRLGATEVARALLEKSSTTHGAVTVGRSSRGGYKHEVVVPFGGDLALETAEQAAEEAATVAASLAERFGEVDSSTSTRSSSA